MQRKYSRIKTELDMVSALHEAKNVVLKYLPVKGV